MSSQSTPPSSQEDPRTTRVVVVPLIIGFYNQESDPNRPGPESMMLVNPINGLTMILDGSRDFLDSIFHDLGHKDGPLPASKASIEAMPVVEVTDKGEECAICLTDYGVGGEAKEMPCKHRYHVGCIGKWLGIHGSCPVCRYKMPVEDEEENKKGGGGGDGSDGDGRVGGEVSVHLFFGGGRINSDSGRENGSDNGDAGEGDGLSSAENMEIDRD